MQMERKSFALEVKQIEDTGTFEGYAAAFGNVDAWNDIIEPGAFKATIKKYKKQGKKVPMLWQHDGGKPIGSFSSMKEDDHGLFVQGRLLKDSVAQAAEAYALLKEGVISGMSIGFYARDYSMDEKTWIRTLKEIDLVETSLVTFPANDKAQVTDVKTASRITTIREFEAALRDVMGFSATEAKRIASCGFKARDERDNSAEAAAIIKQLKTLFQ